MTNEEALDKVMESFETPPEIAGIVNKEAIKKLIDAAVKKWLEDNGLTEENIKELGKNFEKAKEEFIKGKEKALKEAAAELRVAFSEIKTGIKQITTDVGLIISNMVMPSVITVPPGVPNPISVAGDLAQKKGALSKSLFNLNVASIKVLNAAIKMDIQLPEPVLGVIASVADLSKLINTIP